MRKRRIVQISDIMLSTGLVFILSSVFHFAIFIFSKIIRSEFLNPEAAIERDFKLEDLFFSLSPKTDELVSSEIIIVNVKDMGRDSIAIVINTILKAGPKALGIDLLFEGKSVNPASDSSLLKAIINKKNIVLSSEYRMASENEIYVKSFESLAGDTPYGYTNYTGENMYSTTREFTPKKADDLSFSLAVIKTYDSLLYENYVREKRQKEKIHFKNSNRPFITMDAMAFVQDTGSVDLLKDKIVLLGYCGGGSNALEDKHYTPLNNHLFERNLPDTYGPEIQAFAIATIINKDYLKKLPSWVLLIVEVIICMLQLALFIKINHTSKLFFLVSFIIVQSVSSLLVVLSAAWLFSHLGIITDLVTILIPVWLCGEAIHFAEIIIPGITQIRYFRRFNLKTSFSHK